MAGPGKRGRKAIDIPVEKVEALAAQGMTDEQICHIIGVSHEVRRDIAEQLEVDGKCRIAGEP
jgi:hypothetical protein